MTSSTALYDKATEKELQVMAVYGRTDAAISELYRRYRDRIFRLVSSYARDSDDAQDITQQVFIRAYRSLHRFRGQSQLYTWLHRIAINCCKDWIKQAQCTRYDSQDDAWWSGRATGECLFTSPVHADASVERREAADALQKALAMLKPEFRSALVLREMKGLSYREVGVALACSEGTVKSRIFRARQQLRSALISLGHAL